MVLGALGAGSLRAAVINVSSPSGLAAAVAGAAAGDEIVLANGTYNNTGLLQLTSSAGTLAQPVIIRAATPGLAILRGKSGFRLTGSYLVLRDFLFYQCRYLSTESLSNAVTFYQASNCQLLNNRFFECGRTDTSFGHVVRLEYLSANNTIAWNTFEGSTSMSIGIVASASTGNNTTNNAGNIIENNRFLNIRPVGEIFAGQSNGLECVQVGQGVSASGDASVNYVFSTQIRRNRFENVTGDGNEIISIKTSGNTVSENTVINCNSAFSLRNGNNNAALGNFFINSDASLANAGGINVVSGTGNVVANNYFSGLNKFAIQLYDRNGQSDRQQVIGTRIAHNTFAYQRGNVMRLGQSVPSTAPSGTIVENNVWAQSASSVAIERWTNSSLSMTYAGNYFWLTGSASLGNVGGSSGGMTTNINPGLLTAAEGLWRPGTAALAGLGSTLATGLSVASDFDGATRAAPPWPGADEGVATAATAAPSALRIAASSSSGATWTIPPQVSVAASPAEAREEGAIPAAFIFSRSAISTGSPLTFTYSLGGTATGGINGNGDYDTRSLTGSVTIPAGATSVSIAVIPIDDALPEINKTVLLTVLTSGGQLLAGDGTATVTLRDNDLLAPAALNLTAAPGGSSSRAVVATNPTTATADYALVSDGYLLPETSADAGGPAYVWNDIAATGTRLTALDNTNDDFAAVTLPFAFPFYGRFYSTLYVTTNGWIGLVPPAIPVTAATPQLPTPQAPRALIALAMRDLSLDASSRITWRATAADTVVVQFDGLRTPSSSTQRITAQAVFTASGEIRFYYQSNTLANPEQTIGLQDADGLRSALYAFLNINPAANTALRFRPIGIPYYSAPKTSASGATTFVWSDISSTGTRVTALDNQDDAVTPISLPFAFPFYGQNFSTAHLTTNGFITFTAPGFPVSASSRLPNTSVFKNLIAFAWQDLRLDANSRIYTQTSTDGTAFTIQFQNLADAIFSTNRLTAQVVLRKSGDIQFHYLSSSLAALGSNFSYGIGIQDSTGRDGYSASFRPASTAPFLANNFSVRFTPVRNWLSVTPVQATAAANGGTASLTIQASALNAGAGESFAYDLPFARTDGSETLSLPLLFTVSALSAPTGLTCTPATPAGVRLDWTDTATGESGYQVERQSTPGGAWTTVTSSLAANTITYTDTNASAGVWLAYRVRALGTPANSGPSNPASIYTPLATPTAGSVTILTGTSLRVSRSETALPAGLVATTWERSANAGSSWQALPDQSASVTTFDDTGLTFSTAYLYRYRTVTQGSSSMPSASFGATTLSALANWIAVNFTAAELLDAHISGPLADPDGDGLVNILEKALALNPRSAASSSQPVGSVNSGALALTYTRFSNSGLTYTPEATSNLAGSWTSGGTVFATEQVTPLSNGLEQVVSRDLTPLASAPNGRRFLRLRIGGWQTFASTVTLTPSTDIRLRDDNGDGTADLLDADTTDRLQTGDVANNAAWRSVYVFPFAYDDITAVLAAQNVTLRLTIAQVVGASTLPTFTLQIVTLPDPGADSISIDDYAAAGTIIYSAPLAANLAASQVLTFDVTTAAKAAARAGNRFVIRVQTSPATNNNGVTEFVAFYSGSGGINTSEQRPQLLISQ